MAFAPLFPLTKQFQARNGQNNVGGYLRVYLYGTDDRAVTYKDYSGTLNTADIVLDNNGRAVVICDNTRSYRLEVYDRSGDLLWTQQPTTCVAGGGGMSMVDIQSTDGSVVVQKTTSGGMTTYDLSVDNNDNPDFLDWIKCSWYDLVDGAYVPRYSAGTMSVGAKGLNLAADMLYHVTATVRANKTGERSPFYDNIGVHFSLFDGENTVEVQNFTRIVDHSLGLSQDFTVDADIKVGSLASQLVVTIDGAESGITFNLMSVEAHRVYSGVPMLPDGVARQDWVNQNFQKKLVAGDNITIDPTTNETVLWEGTKSAVSDTISLSEDASNFDMIRFYVKSHDSSELWVFVGKITTQSAIQILGYVSGNTWYYQWGCIKLTISSGNTVLTIAKNDCFYLNGTSIGKSNDYCEITKIVGINRIASN